MSNVSASFCAESSVFEKPLSSQETSTSGESSGAQKSSADTKQGSTPLTQHSSPSLFQGRDEWKKVYISYLESPLLKSSVKNKTLSFKPRSFSHDESLHTQLNKRGLKIRDGDDLVLPFWFRLNTNIILVPQDHLLLRRAPSHGATPMKINEQYSPLDELRMSLLANPEEDSKDLVDPVDDTAAKGQAPKEEYNSLNILSDSFQCNFNTFTVGPFQEYSSISESDVVQHSVTSVTSPQPHKFRPHLPRKWQSTKRARDNDSGSVSVSSYSVTKRMRFRRWWHEITGFGKAK